MKPLLAALGCAVGLAAIGLATFATGAGREFDVDALGGMMRLGDEAPVQRGANLAQFADGASFLVLVAVLVAVAVARRRLRLAIAVALVPACAVLSAEVLKHVTAAPRGTALVEDMSWPSGHVTGMASLALCLILVAPSRLRLAAALLSWLGIVGVAFSVIVTGSHMPSDALAGVLLAALWTALALAALSRQRLAPSAPAARHAPS